MGVMSVDCGRGLLGHLALFSGLDIVVQPRGYLLLSPALDNQDCSQNCQTT